MTDAEQQLTAVREQIDAIDRQIQSLINQRAVCAQKVAEIKKAALEASASDTGSGVQYYRPEREAQVLRGVMERNEGPLPPKQVAHIFREIMSSCLALEHPLRVAYLGPEGTFTQQALQKHFGHAVSGLALSGIGDVFEQVERGEADYGVVPVENSTEGMVAHTLDSFMQSSVQICGEVELPISLHLLAKEQDAEITRICAHQQALAQSRTWLEHHYPSVELLAVSSNAEAARMAAEDATLAAVAGEIAMDRYALVPLARNIQDLAANTTRFLIIGRERIKPSGRDKTSVVVSTRNKPGALYNILAPFQKAGLSLTRIDSRPSRTETWSYLFFIEFEGHADTPEVGRVLSELEEHTSMLKRLGSYPQAAI